jgi:hypothetical protein
MRASTEKLESTVAILSQSPAPRLCLHPEPNQYANYAFEWPSTAPDFYRALQVKNQRAHKMITHIKSVDNKRHTIGVQLFFKDDIVPVTFGKTDGDGFTSVTFNH